MEGLSLPVLVLIFVVAAAVVWWSGIRLSNTTDSLDRRFGLGNALGGLILLAFTTNLPEIAIVTSAALGGTIELAVGNLMGGIAAQLLVLALLDIVGRGGGVPLTSRTTSLVPAVEAVMVVMGLTLVLLGSQVSSITYVRVEPATLLIVFSWLAGLLLVRKANRGLPWKPDEPGQQGSEHQSQQRSGGGTTRTLGLFVLAAVLTLAGGFALERSSSAIAAELGIGNVVFGATFLAIATSVPEISTGVQAVKLGDHQLAISDIFGGNAFLPTLLLLAGVLSGKAVVAAANTASLYVAALGIVLTCVYLVGLVFRNRHTVLHMGYDSLLVIILYCIGIAGLLLVG